eukprot:m51a1_g6627 putative u2 small nuclear ribonucleoprotein a (261) ;mRNA; f:59995-61148
MVKINADLIQRAPFRINALKDRELDLRGNKIPAIENLGVAQDAFDAIDLSDNDITRLENFPLMARLRVLLVNNNRVAHIAPLRDQIPHLHMLVLTGNKITSLKEIDNLVGLLDLEHLSLMDNPIAKLPNYRTYVVHTLPQVRVLDFRKVKQKERIAAEQIFGPAVPQKPVAAQQGKASAAAAAAPQAAPAASSAAAAAIVRAAAAAKKTQQDQELAIKAAIKNVKTMEEAAALERALASGDIPKLPAAAAASTSGTADPQ